TAITDGKAQHPKTYWKAEAVDNFGNISLARLGNGIETIQAANPDTGRIESIAAALSNRFSGVALYHP
ncbi:hypothetical protein, partial [Spartinivicinus marinus]|uniref:hypothetical protein n=1 Tax=Spartinivicinus marinus TaxID=2994442 RepID=UPI001C5CA337